MTATLASARRMLERTGEHAVVSVFFDLDPAQFATAPARSTQARSLIDEAARAAASYEPLDHEDRSVLREDLKRLGDYLESEELPVAGAGSLGIFVSGRDDLFETVKLSEPVPAQARIARTPYIEPLVTGPAPGRWCVVLISRRTAKILAGELAQVDEQERVTDDVRGQSRRGGWSQANYERSADDEAEQHLRHVAAELYHLWQRDPFAHLVLGGPEVDVDRFVERLSNDLRPALTRARLGLDAETASVAEVQAALLPLRREAQVADADAAVTALGSRLDGGGAAVAGLDGTLSALAERRVENLVLGLNFAAAGGRCPSCGLLYAQSSGSCPVDGTEREPVADLREAAVQAAVLQDAAVTVVGDGSDPPPPVLRRHDGIGALLRF